MATLLDANRRNHLDSSRRRSFVYTFVSIEWRFKNSACVRAIAFFDLNDRDESRLRKCDDPRATIFFSFTVVRIAVVDGFCSSRLKSKRFVSIFQVSVDDKIIYRTTRKTAINICGGNCVRVRNECSYYYVQSRYGTNYSFSSRN